MNQFKYFLYVFRRNILLEYLSDKKMVTPLINTLKEFKKCVLQVPTLIVFQDRRTHISPASLDIKIEKNKSFLIECLNLEALSELMPQHVRQMDKFFLFYVLAHEIVHIVDLCTLHALANAFDIHKDGLVSTASVLEDLAELTPIYLKKFFASKDLSFDFNEVRWVFTLAEQYHSAVSETHSITNLWGLHLPDQREILKWYAGDFDDFIEFSIRLILPTKSDNLGCVSLTICDDKLLGVLGSLKKSFISIEDIFVKCDEIIHNVGIYTWSWALSSKNPRSSALDIPILIRARLKRSPRLITFLIFFVRPPEDGMALYTTFIPRIRLMLKKLKDMFPYVYSEMIYDPKVLSGLILSGILSYSKRAKYFDLAKEKIINSDEDIYEKWVVIFEKLLKISEVDKISMVELNYRALLNHLKRIPPAPLVFFVLNTWDINIGLVIKEVISIMKPRLVAFVLPMFSYLPPSKFLKDLKTEVCVILLGKDEEMDVILTVDEIELLEAESTYRGLYQLSL